ncbi:MAG: hypothetical protein QOI45_2486, partial [Thermoleophilaceae bacterium]|nr:hypothetical protein [Thermoleophilaceae bacterium]
MDLAALRVRLARRWWVVAAVAALAALGAAVAAAGEPGEHRATVEFVLRPDVSVTNSDLPGTLDALKSDSPLVHTVVGVLRSRAILRRAATDAGVQLGPDYTIESTLQPGSTLIDSTLAGPDRTLVTRLAAGYARAASNYVAASYSAYALERLSTQADVGSSGPGTAQVVILALLVGSALGVALVAGELRIEPQLRRLVEQVEGRRAAAAGEAKAEAAARRDRPEAAARDERPEAAAARDERPEAAAARDERP